MTAGAITDPHRMRGRAGRFDARDQTVLTIAGAGRGRAVHITSTDTVVGCGWS